MSFLANQHHYYICQVAVFFRIGVQKSSPLVSKFRNSWQIQMVMERLAI
jgi:hypothetical protein